MRALLFLPSVVIRISAQYSLQETTFVNFLSAFDGRYFFSSLVGDAYRRARYLETRPSLYRTLRDAQKYHCGYFAFWVAHQEGILNAKDTYQPE